jgi:hypothetical protein
VFVTVPHCTLLIMIITDDYLGALGSTSRNADCTGDAWLILLCAQTDRLAWCGWVAEHLEREPVKTSDPPAHVTTSADLASNADGFLHQAVTREQRQSTCGTALRAQAL